MFWGKRVFRAFDTTIKYMLGKRRKYPFKLDECGASARMRAFTLFDGGSLPSDIAGLIGLSKRTAYRYFEDWKKLGRKFPQRYQGAKAILKNEDFSARTIMLLAQFLELHPKEVVERIQKPWGIKRLLMGRWPNPRKDRLFLEREKRLYAALRIINITETRLTLDEIGAVIDKLIHQANENKEGDSAKSGI